MGRQGRMVRPSVLAPRVPRTVVRLDREHVDQSRYLEEPPYHGRRVQDGEVPTLSLKRIVRRNEQGKPS